jgi:hypothetical protein
MNRPAATADADWVRCAEAIDGVERIEAWLKGKAYAMHRHDTYAIGRTLAGVQSFSYRRSRRDSLPGNSSRRPAGGSGMRGAYMAPETPTIVQYTCNVPVYRSRIAS